METKQTAVLFFMCVITVVAGGCDSHTCGINARCTTNEGRRVCSCFKFHVGDPLVKCFRVECASSANCLDDECIKYHCGENALCEATNQLPVCYCPPGYTGDPFVRCQKIDSQAACKPSPCGVNTKCEVINEIPVCSCLPGYRGSPLIGCRHECESDGDCPGHLACSVGFKCESPCKCGENANCEVINHQAKCTCPRNWQGNPHIACHPECTYHSECPRNKPACLHQKCVNPCDGVCGVNANCELRDITPICSCPRHMTGDPFVKCRPFTPQDLCEPNPCGVNAMCTPGHDNTGKERPVCTCPTGYLGNALISCQRGECFTDNECPDSKACINYTCQNPCTGHQCGVGAVCTPRRHVAVCTCPDGTRGDALISCNPTTSRYVYGRLIRY